MAVSIQVLAKNLFNALLSFKQQNALRGLVTARCTVLALRSKQVKFLHFFSSHGLPLAGGSLLSSGPE